MTSVAIIISTIEERHRALLRSMYTWQKSCSAAKVDFCIYVTAEGYVDKAHVEWPKSMYVKHRYTELSGSHIAGYNYWYNQLSADKSAEPDFYIFTHPDMLVPENTVKVAVERAEKDVYVTFKCFWIPPDMTERISEYDWSDPESLEKEPELYSMDDFLKGSFYVNKTARDILVWESSTTHCINNKVAARLYPFPDLGHQGWDDPYQAGLRNVLGIKTDTVMEPMLYHQFHRNTRHDKEGQAVREASELIDKYIKERM